jgi:hypothetical protein
MPPRLCRGAAETVAVSDMEVSDMLNLSLEVGFGMGGLPGFMERLDLTPAV